MLRRRPRRAVLAIALAVGVLAAAPSAATDGDEPDDPAFADGLQWNLAAVGAPQAWAVTTGAGQVVAVVDTGVAADHPDLAGKVVGGTTCLDTQGDPGRCRGGGHDQDGHGTHVAGIVAARAGNGVGITGVAPDADLLAVRVLAARRSGPAEGSALDVAAGIRWATDNGATVINLSLGTSDGIGTRSLIATAVEDAFARGVVVVVAARNDRLAASLAGLPLIVVTALDRTGALAPYARGVADAQWSLSAPGGQPGDSEASCGLGGVPRGILSTWLPSGDQRAPYACLSGTSMAAPHVSGAAALLLARGLSAGEVVDRLLASARDLGPPGRDPYFGDGGLDLAAAVGRPPASGVAPEVEDRAVAQAGDGGRVVVTDLAEEHGERRSRPVGDRLVPVLMLGLAALLGALLIVVHQRRADEDRPGAPPPAR